MSVLYAESRSVRRRPWYLAQLTVLGAGLVAAALHGSPNTAPQRATAVTYQPRPVAPVTAPAGEVHTMSGAGVVPARKAASAPRRVAAPARKPGATKPAAARRTATVPMAGTTFQQSLDRAIARIPTYRPGVARWVVSRAYDFWGTADWYHDVLYVSPDVPLAKLYDVAVHEWSHELSVLDYGGDVAAATAAMNTWFGGSDLTGPERAADCMAILQGARWTHYTTCTNPTWRVGAARLLAGQQL